MRRVGFASLFVPAWACGSRNRPGWAGPLKRPTICYESLRLKSRSRFVLTHDRSRAVSLLSSRINTSRMVSQSGEPSVMPCPSVAMSAAPGPSVVPAANEYLPHQRDDMQLEWTGGVASSLWCRGRVPHRRPAGPPDARHLKKRLKVSPRHQRDNAAPCPLQLHFISLVSHWIDSVRPPRREARRLSCV